MFSRKYQRMAEQFQECIFLDIVGDESTDTRVSAAHPWSNAQASTLCGHTLRRVVVLQSHALQICLHPVERSLLFEPRQSVCFAQALQEWFPGSHGGMPLAIGRVSAGVGLLQQPQQPAQREGAPVQQPDMQEPALLRLKLHFRESLQAAHEDLWQGCMCHACCSRPGI